MGNPILGKSIGRRVSVFFGFLSKSKLRLFVLFGFATHDPLKVSTTFVAAMSGRSCQNLSANICKQQFCSQILSCLVM